jgi:hypothetical protein
MTPTLRFIIPIFLLPLAAVEYLNFTGFCYGEGRHYSDDQLIDVAIKYNIKIQSMNPETKRKYRSVAEFKQQNPECCTVYRYGHSALDPIWVRLIGFYRVVVEVWYKTNEPGEADRFYDSIVTLDACDQIVEAQGISETHDRIVPARRR